MNPLIEIKNLSLTYDAGTPRETKALKNIHLTVRAGEYVVLFGPSGCGKSTLLYCISGLLRPTAGNIFISEKDITALSSGAMADFHRRQMGIVFQAYNLITTLSVLDNVALPQTFRGADMRQRGQAAKKQLERFGLLYAADRFPQELSGGQQQRVAMARALVNDPRLILGDEPVGNLDSAAANEVMGLFSEMNEKDKKTVVMVTHNAAHFAFADRVLFMKDGQIIKEETNAHKEKNTGMPVISAAEKRDAAGSVHAFADAFSSAVLYATEVYLKEKMERIIAGVVQGTVSLEECAHTLVEPLRDGGFGFENERAHALVRRLEAVLFESRLLRGKTEGELRRAALGMETGELRKYVLAGYKKSLAFLQIKRLEEAIGDLVRGIINEDGFSRVCALSEAQGGIGISSGDAFRFLFKLNLVLKLR